MIVLSATVSGVSIISFPSIAGAPAGIEEILKEEKIYTQHDVENKQLKEENEQLRKNNVVKDAKIEELIEKLKEIKKVLKKIKIRQIIILIGLTKISLKKC